MTIKVNGPGFAVNFPDGTDKETIERVMREAHAKRQGAQATVNSDLTSAGNPSAPRPGTTRLRINGHLVDVSDDFMSMSREQQDATVDEIARELSANPMPGAAPGQRPAGRPPKLVPVDHDPFAPGKANPFMSLPDAAPKLVPVDHDPFAAAQPAAGSNVAAKGDRQRAPADFAKIKRNIQRMIDQNAPESDIDAYVASEGVTAEQLRAAPKGDPFAAGVIEIRGPDGSINRFPAGTDDATIERAMRAIYGGPEGTVEVPDGVADRSFGRGLAIGTQSVGKGLANVAGAPNDLATLFLNGLAGGINVSGDALEALARWAGSDFAIPDIPRFRSVIGGEQISGVASDIFEAAGGHTIRQDEMTPEQQVGSTLVDFGTQAATGGAGLIKAAATKTAQAGPKIADVASDFIGEAGAKGTSSLGNMLANVIPDYITNPYKAAPGRMLAGDTAGGVGSGAALEAADEYLPENVAKNPLVRFIAAMLGGGAGATALGVGTNIAKGDPLKPLTDRLPASKIFQDPNAVVPVSNRSAQQAVDYVHANASNPQSALAQLLESLNFFGEAGGAVPTTGLMTDDVGLQLIEHDLRKTNAKPFIERDNAVRTSAFRDVESLKPEGASPYKPRQVSEDEIAARTGAADAAVRAKQDQLASADKSDALLGWQFEQPPMNREEASIALDKALIGDTAIPMRTQKRDLYESIDPEGTEMIDTENLVALAKELEQATRSYLPSTRARMAPEGLISDIKAYEPKIDPKTGENIGGPGRVSFRNLNEWRKPLSEMENEARRAGQAGIADSIAKIRRAIGDETETLAASGSPAGERAAEANRFYKEDYRPFREGEVGNLMKKIARNPQRDQTPASETASKLIVKGAGAPEAGRNVNEAINRGTPEAQKASREAIKNYFLSDLRNVVVKGKVDENKLQRWLNVNASTLDAYPGFKKEVTDLLENVRGRSIRNSQLEAELKEAAANRQMTEREINKSVFATFANREPEKAVAALFAADDPSSMVKQFRTRFAGDKEAEAGLRAAVADHIIDQVRTAGQAGVTDGALPISLAKVESTFRRSERLLREVFGSDLRYLNQARKRLEALSRHVNAGTAEQAPIKRTGLDRLRKAGLKSVEIVAKIAFGQLQGGGYTRSARLLAEQMPDSTAAARDLVLRMSFDPELAQHVLAATPKAALAPRWNKRLRNLMGWAEVGRTWPQDEDRDEQ